MDLGMSVYPEITATAVTSRRGRRCSNRPAARRGVIIPTDAWDRQRPFLNHAVRRYGGSTEQGIEIES
jgi:hypothetical protein